MKYWRGYLTAAIFGAMTWALMQLGQRYSQLVDMVYPYVTRSVQAVLTAWTGAFDYNIWQLALIVFAVVALGALVVTVIRKKSVIQWFGWVAAAVSFVVLANTAVYGLNYYAGPIENDLRLEMTDYSQIELEYATEFYRDKANSLAVMMPRDEQGVATFPEFDDMAQKTGNGFRHLVLDRSFSIFGGDYTPVKQLGWAELYNGKGVAGKTVFLTGEAAVNPLIPGPILPFTMSHEMAHRMCVAREEAADFAAFLACEASDSLQYRYSGYFMAYYFCYSALSSVDSAAAKRISEGCINELKWDLDFCRPFFERARSEQAARLHNGLGDLYLRGFGETAGAAAHGVMSDYLVNWFLSEYAVPEEVEEKFDPYDETQVDLSGIVNAKPVETAPEE